MLYLIVTKDSGGEKSLNHATEATIRLLTDDLPCLYRQGS